MGRNGLDVEEVLNGSVFWGYSFQRSDALVFCEHHSEYHDLTFQYEQDHDRHDEDQEHVHGYL